MPAHCRIALPLLAAILVAGCGSGHVAISGTVVYDDGSTVDEGTVCGELIGGGTHMAQGVIKNGAFSLGTSRPGDGVKPGIYKIMIQCRALGDAEKSQGKQPAIDKKFGNYETSGLTLDATEANRDVQFVVKRPAKAKSS